MTISKKTSAAPEDEFFAHNYLLVELPGTTPATTPQSRYARQLP